MKHRVWKLAGVKPRSRCGPPGSRNLPNMFINKCPKFQLKTRSGLWEISIGKHLKFKSWTCPKWTVISIIEMPKTHISVPQIKKFPTWKMFKMVFLARIHSLKLSRVSTGHSTQLNMQICTIYKKYEKRNVHTHTWIGPAVLGYLLDVKNYVWRWLGVLALRKARATIRAKIHDFEVRIELVLLHNTLL